MIKVILLTIVYLFIPLHIYAQTITKQFDVAFSWLPVKYDQAGRDLIGFKGYRIYISPSSIVDCPKCPECPSPSPGISLPPAPIANISTPPVVTSLPDRTITFDTQSTIFTTKLPSGTYYVSVAAIANSIGPRSEQIRFIVPTTAPDKPKFVLLNIRIP